LGLGCKGALESEYNLLLIVVTRLGDFKVAIYLPFNAIILWRQRGEKVVENTEQERNCSDGKHKEQHY